MWIFLALVAVPIVEIALFIEVGGWLGLWPTLGIVVATAAVGTLLLKNQAPIAMAKLDGRLPQGRDLIAMLTQGALFLVAGVLLLTPGFFTDALGLALLLPPVRTKVAAMIAERVELAEVQRAQERGRRAPPRGETIDAEYEEVAPARGEGRPSGWQGGPGGNADGRG